MNPVSGSVASRHATIPEAAFHQCDSITEIIGVVQQQLFIFM